MAIIVVEVLSRMPTETDPIAENVHELALQSALERLAQLRSLLSAAERAQAETEGEAQRVQLAYRELEHKLAVERHEHEQTANHLEEMSQRQHDCIVFGIRAALGMEATVKGAGPFEAIIAMATATTTSFAGFAMRDALERLFELRESYEEPIQTIERLAMAYERLDDAARAELRAQNGGPDVR